MESYTYLLKCERLKASPSRLYEPSILTNYSSQTTPADDHVRKEQVTFRGRRF